MKGKRVISAILSGIMSITTAASGFTSYAAESIATKSAVESGEISVGAENSLGSLFSEEIGQELQQQENAGNSITSVEIAEKTATVTYNSAIDCTIMVGIYDESGKMLLGSGTADVLSTETTATVDIEIDTMPEYFYVKAYLVDGLGLAPLSEVYENPNYTSQMEEFFSKTTADFDAERVLNFDEDTTNNFAVYSEDVILLEEVEGYNDVVMCDHENGVYVFENADNTLISLNSGDILSYDYGDESEIIIVKVDTITVDGTTVTITAAETGLDEVFEYIRLDEQAEQSEAEYSTDGIPNVIESDFTNLDHSDEFAETETTTESTDEYTLQYDDGVDVLSDEKVDVKSKLELEIENGKAEVSKNDTVKITFVSNEESAEDKGSNVKLKADIFSGTLLYTSTLSLKLYFSDSSKSDDFDANKDSGLINFLEVKWKQSLTISGKMSASVSKEFPLFNVTYAIGYGFFITFEPKFIVGGDAELELNGYFTETLGFRVQNGLSTSISEKPYFAPSVKVKGTFYVGLDIGPTIKWISKYLACVETEISGKVKITAESEVKLGETGGNGKPKDKHECTDDVLTGLVDGCLDGRIDFIITIGGTGKILNNDKLKIKLEAEFSFHFKDFYYSAVFDEFEWGKCPHKFYYYELTVIDIDENPIEGAEVTLNAETIETDSEGKALLYFKTGDNDVSIKHDDYDYFSETYTVKVTRKNKNSGSVSGSKKDENTSVNVSGEFFETDEVVKINNEESRSQEIKLRDKAYTVSVTVVDGEGNPVRNVNIASNCDDEYYTTEGKTGFNGTYKLKLPNGEWEITASTRGYVPASEIVTVEDADTEITLTIVGNPCTFTVTDQYGDPVNGAKLLFTNTETGESVSSLDPTTDENGLYTYSFDVGEYAFTATKKGYDDYEGSFTVPEGGTEVEVEMYCNLQKVTVIVEDESGSPLSGVSVKSYYDNITSTTDDNGTVIIKLPVGETELRFIKDGYYTSKSYLTINEGEDITATFQLEATSSDTSSSGATWTFDEDTGVLTISGTGATGTVDDVTYDDEIKSVIIKNGITSISDYAFRGCSSLITITIPNSVTSIGDRAFYDCDALTSITIPDGVTSIGNSVFYDCDALTTITISDSVTTIGKSVFEDCDALTSITIPDSVTSIGGNAFYGCDALTSITIPDSVTSIGDDAFMYCFALTRLIIADGSETITSAMTDELENLIEEVIIPESVMSIGNSAFSQCSALTTVIIPDSVTSIGDHAFAQCNALSSVTIGDSVTSIEYNAFDGCSALTSITIPDSVTSIGYSAFSDCTALTTITISDSVTNIGGQAFAGCNALTTLIIADGSETLTLEMVQRFIALIEEVIIPDSVMYIEYGIFSSMSELEKINVSAENEYYTSEAGVLFNKDMTILIQYPAGKMDETYIIRNGVTSIGNWAFSDCTSLTSVIIPDSVTSIGDYTFYNCLSLTSITIPDSVTSIGSYAFNYCPVTVLIIADGSKTVTSEMICSAAVKEIVIPESVTIIEKRAFENCDALTSITIPDSVISIGEEAFYSCNALTTIEIGKGVKSIGDYAFLQCSALITITIPESVTSIGDNVFFLCDALTAINVEAENSSYISVDGVLFNKDMTTLLRYPEGKVGEAYTIPDSVTSIGNDAFYYCDALTTIIIPESVTSIGDDAFRGCDALTSITIPDSVTSIGDTAFFNYYDVLTDVYYTGTEEQWNAITIGSSNDSLTSATIHYNYTPEETAASSYILKNASEVQILSDETTEATTITTSETTTTTITSETTTTTTVTDAVYIDLEPGRIYNFYAMYSTEAEDLLSAENLIYMSQGIADENGMLAFGYLPKAAGVEVEHVIVGMIYCIEHADISVEDMECTGSELTVEVIVTDDGETLVEGTDYTLSGTLSTTKPGIYEVKVSGIGDYYGDKYVYYTVTCEHEYAEGICTICETQCVHIYEDGVCTVCGEVMPVTTTTTTTIITTTTTTDENYSVMASGTCGDNLTWVLDNYGILTISGTGDMTDWEISSVTFTSGGLKDVSFKGDAVPWFNYCNDISSVIIEDGVNSIGDSAFVLCKMNEILIPESVTSIGFSAFRGCSALTVVTIPESVIIIESHAFSDCRSLTDITIPNSVISIERSTFSSCRSLTDVTIPDNVTSIGDYTFYNCTSLTSITIENPECVIYASSDTISDTAVIYGYENSTAQAYAENFSRTFVSLNEATTTTITTTTTTTTTTITTTAITTMTTDMEYSVIASGTCGDNLTWVLDNYGILTISGTGDMTDWITESSIPWRSYRSLIKNVFIEYGVTSIGEYAFYYCSSSLTSISIPDSVTSIGHFAFEGCSTLTEITIPDNVISIGNYAFCDCDSLTSITISDNVTSIGRGAFAQCNELTGVYADAKNINYTSVDGVLFNKDMTILVQYTAGKTDDTYIIPDSVTSIGDYAFSGCYALTSMSIPDSVTSIGYNAFSYCGALTSVIIPNSVTSIGNAAFKNCGKLTTIIISNSVTSIGNNAFMDCENLTTIKIPDSVTSIGNYAFMNCIKLTTITIPDSVTSIGDHAFDECYGLKSITIENPECDIYDSYDTTPGGLWITIYGYENSTAQAYAEKYHKNFIAIDEITITTTLTTATLPVTTTTTVTEVTVLLGDVDLDGAVNAVDASMVLAEYAIIATGGTPTFSEKQTKAADVNADGATDAIDASSILGYYAYIATGGNGTIEEYLNS